MLSRGNASLWVHPVPTQWGEGWIELDRLAGLDWAISRIQPPGEPRPAAWRGLPAGTGPVWLGDLERLIQRFYEGNPVPAEDVWDTWAPRLDPRGLTPFRRLVMRYVSAISVGKTMTYGEVAAAIGRPPAARAVGGVMRTNRWPILIPCHRVMGANQKPVGFSAPGGICTKLRMLNLEAAGGLVGAGS